MRFYADVQCGTADDLEAALARMLEDVRSGFASGGGHKDACEQGEDDESWHEYRFEVERRPDPV